jgi:hypothetical protein
MIMATLTKEIVRESAASQSALPEPPRLFSRRVFGPSAVFTALAIGSGELIFWPGLSLPYGAGVLWIALAAVALQYFMNVEIGRYSLATGESVVVGAARLWRGWGWILLLGTVVPWLWPGWARAGAQVLGGAYGVPEKYITICSLILCGVLLAVPSKVYRLVEGLQSLLLAFIVVGVLILFILVAQNAPTSATPFWGSFFSGEGITSLLSKVGNARSADFLALLSGIVFAGAGGILNLGYGLLLCEKQFGMGKYAQPVVGLRHSLGLKATDTSRPDMGTGAETERRWRRWLTLSRREHVLLFVAGNCFTIIFLSLIFFYLLGRSTGVQGLAFLQVATDRLSETVGSGASHLFVAVAVAILFTSEIGIIDITSRLAAGIVHSTFRPRRLSASFVYHLVVWIEIIIGIALTALDPRQPFWFLVTSGVLNVLVMAIYSALVLLLNRRTLPPLARPRRGADLLMGGAAVLYLSLFLITILSLR